MKRNIIITTILLLLLFSCTNQEKRTKYPKIIDIENCIQNLTQLKASDFGKTIRYIPLETTGSVKVDKYPIVKVLKNHIIIEANKKNCLLFDKKDGRFIAEIGHFGQDDEAFSDIFSWADEKEEFLYFKRSPNQLIKYDMKGNFCGQVEFSIPGFASHYLITDKEIIGYFVATHLKQYALGIFDKEGMLKDTISTSFQRTEFTSEGITAIGQLRDNRFFYSQYGIWLNSGAYFVDYQDNSRLIMASNEESIWRNKGNVFFKEVFVDTIFTLTGNKLVPSIVFNTGKYHLPVQDAINRNIFSEQIFISYISENDKFIFFQCLKGLHAGTTLYHGLYNKKTCETKLGEHDATIKDDLTHFMPFTPLGISTSGEFVSLVEAQDVMDWMRVYPEAVNNEKLSFLKGFNSDMNPIVILIE